MQLNPVILLCVCSIVLSLPTQTKAQAYQKNDTSNRAFLKNPSSNVLSQIVDDSTTRLQSTVIGFSTGNWYKRQPESRLGNFMADCLFQSASRFNKNHIDIAILNYGAIRSYIPQGDVTIRMCYDLMPFNNKIVLLQIDGNTLHQLLDLIAYKGGWPVSGITMKIKQSKASDILVNGKPLQDTMLYNIATVDYLARGGEGCTLLKKVVQTNTHFLFRDALIAYIKSFSEAGKAVQANLENRIITENE